MSCVYLILAYRNLAQVDRLIRRLLESDCRIIVHVNSENVLPDSFRKAHDCSRVIYTERRFLTVWGSWEMVLATLGLLEEGLARFPDASQFTTLSGSDYPIKNPEYICSILQESRANFVRRLPLLEEKWKYGGMRRINRFYWARNRKSLAGFFFRTIPCPPRAFPIPPQDIYVGSVFMSLTRESVAGILDAFGRNVKLLSAFRRTYIPEEMLFHTILFKFFENTQICDRPLHYSESFSLPRDYLRLKILNRNGYRTLGLSDFDKIRSSPALFARKFDSTVDSEILDVLDRL